MLIYYVRIKYSRQYSLCKPNVIFSPPFVDVNKTLFLVILRQGLGCCYRLFRNEGHKVKNNRLQNKLLQC
jgi:hypothetical protein